MNRDEDDPLTGLDGIDWASLSHAYGDAADVPARLRAVSGVPLERSSGTPTPDPESTDQAIGELDAAIYHQGERVYSATAGTLGFLIALAADPRTPARVPVIELIGEIAGLLNDPAVGGDSPEATAAAQAVLTAETGRLLSLLEDQDPTVRLAAGVLAAGFTHDADRTVTTLIRPRTREKERRVAVARVLAVGTLGATGALSAAARTAVLDWLVAAGDHPGDPLRLAYLLARRRVAPGSVPAEAVVAALDDRALDPAAYLHTAKTPDALIGWIGGHEIEFARYVTQPGRRRATDAGLAQVGLVMAHSRAATAELVPALVGLLDERSPARRAAASHLLAAAGETTRPYADRLAAITVSDSRPYAVWALARLSDGRAVTALNEAIRLVPAVFPITRQYSHGSLYSFEKPGLADVLVPMRAHAAELIDAVRHRLRPERGSPELHTLTEVVAAWGAAAAVPELIPLLGTEHALFACTALAAVGAAGTAAAPALARVIAGGGPTAQHAARALFRITGDPAPLLGILRLEPRLGVLRLDEPRLTVLDARSLADLGPLAAPYAGAVADRLSADRASWPTSLGVEPAYAHWRMTGDPALCRDVFDAALEPLARGLHNLEIRAALRHLSTMDPTSIRRYEPLLRGVVEADERLRDHHGWRGIAEDDETRKLALALLDRPDP
jgi:hypothetical protein